MVLSKGQVQVIEDDIDLPNSMADLLRFAGYDVAIWSDLQAFLGARLISTLPTVIVTDMRMPGMGGLDLHRRLLDLGWQTPIVYISGESSTQQTIAAMKLGAVDFLIKPFTAQELLAAVEKGVQQDRLLRRQRTATQLLHEKLSALTSRERDVYDCLRKGYNNTEIMKALGLALPTVKQYKTAVMRQLGVSSMAQLLALGEIGR